MLRWAPRWTVYAADMRNGETFHEADARAREHYGNAYLARRGKLRLVRKEYPNSSPQDRHVPTDRTGLRGPSGRHSGRLVGQAR